MNNLILSPKMAAIFLLLEFGVILNTVAQNGNTDEGKRTGIAVVDFDTRDYAINHKVALQYVINELIRVDRFEVRDRYEVEYLAKKDTLEMEGCFSKSCLADFGVRLEVGKMFSGSMLLLGDKVNITLRLFDVGTRTFEKTIVKEFLNIPGNELIMIRVTMNEMFGLKNDEEIVKKLTLKSDYDNAVNNPYQLKLSSEGPRLGMVGFSGVSREVMMNPANKGGYNNYPFMFQFGYQFEKQYLNEGNFQALVEMIPMISGMDQGRIVPSFNFLNGLRSNRSGWEFAFGPTFNVTKMARGFYHEKDGERQWFLSSETGQFSGESLDMEKRPDSRGNLTLTTGFVFAVGKTFKSGRMNIPLNMFFVPGKNGCRFGVSFGWNGKERFELKN